MPFREPTWKFLEIFQDVKKYAKIRIVKNLINHTCTPRTTIIFLEYLLLVELLLNIISYTCNKIKNSLFQVYRVKLYLQKPNLWQNANSISFFKIRNIRSKEKVRLWTHNHSERKPNREKTNRKFRLCKNYHRVYTRHTNINQNSDFSVLDYIKKFDTLSRS